MPSGDENIVSRELYKTLTEVSERLGALALRVDQLEVSVAEKVAVLLSNYREDNFRTSMGIHRRLLSYEEQLREDVKTRAKRQEELDARQHEIDAKLASIQRNQRIWIRVAVALALIATGVVLAWWLL